MNAPQPTKQNDQKVRQQQGPTEEATKMTMEPKRVKMVKIKALRGFRRSVPDGQSKKTRDETVKPGQIIEVTEEEAKLILRPRRGYYDWEGERSNVKGSSKYFVAEIVRD